ncbi:MAG TPA: HAMP domain-containing sensor histidine kinase [Acidimicrobiia bacterium]|nr:HAMP domain-containing sensor histidine kinase [Acidimicrobiia bacterium]
MVSAVIGLLAAASLAAAIVHQVSSSAPIGESEVFSADAMTAAGIVTAEDSPDDGVRRARNRLGIEAVSLVSNDGVIEWSTSRTLTGQPLADPLLSSAVERARFGALAGSTNQAIEIDGVVEWPAGSVLYEVIAPLDDGSGFLMLHYDISQLLGRRAQPGAIQSSTLQLVALSGVFGILGTAVFVGHARAVRRHRAMVLESELLRDHSRELKEANLKLTEARRKAERALVLSEEKMRIRSEFVLMINHELRTPLTSVVTGAELVRDGDLSPAEQREVIDSMVANGNRLGEIIDQILAVARIENRGLAYDTESVSLEEVCRRTGAELLDEAGVAELITVNTDVSTLSLILKSLADNARTHGAEVVAIGCSATTPLIETMVEIGTPPATAVFFTVADDGPGIDPEFLPRVFEKFEKNSFNSGTGLGLYLVQLMVEALSGAIGVRTTPQGTTFQIALPALVRENVMETV